MSAINRIINWFVGGLFVFSGLIKVNDPKGTAIKLEEYFEVFSHDFAAFFGSLHSYALPLAILFCVAEVALGVALIAQFRKKYVLGALLGLIVFFTFLTFYSAYFNKVTDCGCFGDAIKLTPWTSFGKDVVLLICIAWLFAQPGQRTNTASKGASIVTYSGTVIAAFIAFWGVYFLPFVDFLPYKVGNNIGQLMQKPDIACKTIFLMADASGNIYEFEKYPMNRKDLKFDSAIVVNAAECTAKVTDYNLWNAESDYTEESLKGNKLLVVVKQIDQADAEAFTQIAALVNQLPATITAVAVTSDMAERFEDLRHQYQLAIPYYNGDATLLKSMIRANPGLILLQNGTVKGKWSSNNLPDLAELQAALQ